tara:strand:+ start:685 stop:1044 length:360 start_codon:yes stop_codon:yes gene_type:complete
MSIADHLKAALAASNELDKKLARRIGEHIDKQATGLQELRDLAEAKQLAPAAFRSLPAASKNELKTLKIPELKAIATRMNLPGRSKPKRKMDLIEFLSSHNAPLAPSYEQLLSFWVDHR